MIEEQPKPMVRRIQQIRLKFNHDYAPYKHFNPYQLLQELNKAVKGVYDIEFVHVRYIMTKNRAQKELNQRLLNDKQLYIDRDVNNILSIKETAEKEDKEKFQILEYLFGDSIQLKPPNDDRCDFEIQMEKEIIEEEDKKLQNIKNSVQEIMKVYNQNHSAQRTSIRTIESLQTTFSKDYYCQNQYDIFAKGIMNQPTIQKVREQKNSNKPIEIKAKTNTIKIYLNPTQQFDTIDKITEQLPITSWSQGFNWKPGFSEYFATKDLEAKACKINNSVKIINYLSFGKKQNYFYDSISITSYLWNQIVIKVFISMAQVKKIERAVSSDPTKKQKQYYFHLTYPPKYYICNLTKDEANCRKYMRSWDRVQNFIFLDNTYVKENYFIRFFLFNNTIFKINLVEDSAEGYSIAAASEQLDKLFNKFQGTIETKSLPDLYKPEYKFRTLKTHMDYKGFLKKIDVKNQVIMDKVWIVKYLLLVMVRYNYLLPIAEEIDQILNKIQEDIDHIDSYLYILWKTTTNMWGYTNEDKRFYQYMLDESENIKKMKVKDIMKRMLQNSELITYIFRASLTPSGYLFNAPTPEMKGRLLKHYNKEAQFFLRISFNDESEVQLKNQKYITKKVFRNQMDQINILGRKYIPLGWSPSQLRSFSLWYLHEIQDRGEIKKLKRSYILSFLGDFSKIQNPAKRAARIGQSFSSSWTYDGSKIQELRIPDEISETGHLYTDGIGKISKNLIERMSLKLQIRELGVIQMRYKGAKGVLVVDSDLPDNTVVLRKSMIKYECKDDETKRYLDILDWNKYKAGFLNRQIIILLRTLGVQDSVFIGLQEEHIKRISSMTFKDCSIFKHMGSDLNNQINNLESANKTILDLLKAGFQLEKQPFFRGVLETLKKNGYNQLKVKSNIQVQKSARIIGIIDEFQVLEENQIYCSVYDQFSLKPERLVVQGEAIITRNPCLDPADIRKVQCISREQIRRRFQNKNIKPDKFDRFINTVVFPMKGKYPLTAQISGSDLDGDNFFVCWDPRLIPKQVNEAHLIDEAPKQGDKLQSNKDNVTYEQMLNFFIDYANYEKLGQIDNSHLVHADRDLLNYANNKNCQKLAQIHGKAVDFPKSGYCPPVSPELFVSEYPDFMQKDPAVTYPSKSVLGILYQDIKQKIQKLLENKEDAMPHLDQDLISTYDFDQTDQEIKGCMNLLKQYERQIGNLIHLVEVDSEFQIYSGNFSIVKDKVKSFGKNRLIQTILSIRQRFFDIFFEDNPDDFDKYGNNVEEQDESEKHTKVPNLFSEQIRRKTQLYYLVTYIYRFPNITLPHPKFNTLKEQLNTYIQKYRCAKQGQFCGFVWFITPKVIINMKISQKLQQSISEDKKMNIINDGEGDDEQVEKEEEKIENQNDEYI